MIFSENLTQFDYNRWSSCFYDAYDHLQNDVLLIDWGILQKNLDNCNHPLLMEVGWKRQMK